MLKLFYNDPDPDPATTLERVETISVSIVFTLDRNCDHANTPSYDSQKTITDIVAGVYWTETLTSACYLNPWTVTSVTKVLIDSTEVNITDDAALYFYVWEQDEYLKIGDE